MVSKKYFTSDLHLNHERILLLEGRPFKDVHEMNETIINNILKPLKKGDNLFVLGDLSLSLDGFELFFSSLPSKVNFHWVLGNHDERFKKRMIKIHGSKITSVQNIKETKIGNNHVTMCHFPMLSWNFSHRNSWCLFGHHHKGVDSEDKLQELTKGKMLNVNCEYNDFKAWNEEEIYEYMKERPNNWDFLDKNF